MDREFPSVKTPNLEKAKTYPSGLSDILAHWTIAVLSEVEDYWNEIRGGDVSRALVWGASDVDLRLGIIGWYTYKVLVR